MKVLILTIAILFTGIAQAEIVSTKTTFSFDDLNGDLLDINIEDQKAAKALYETLPAEGYKGPLGTYHSAGQVNCVKYNNPKHGYACSISVQVE